MFRAFVAVHGKAWPSGGGSGRRHVEERIDWAAVSTSLNVIQAAERLAMSEQYLHLLPQFHEDVVLASLCLSWLTYQT